ncbi:MAG: hypothetical protein OXI95_15155 [bacterium]|nr:hypothetical protein [bacterium]MDE0418256.1 hypothetical protein [bacterium]
MATREVLNLVDVGGMHPVLEVRATDAQGEDDETTGLQHADEFAKGAGARVGRNMHPDRVEPDEVEACPLLRDSVERRQTVAQPRDPRRGVPPFGFVTHRRRGVDGNDIEVLRREPISIASRSRPDIENRGRSLGEPAGNP